MDTSLQSDRVSQNNKDSVLLYAAEKGYTSLLQFMIGEGANPNVSNCQGKTPLHIVAGEGYADCVQVLVDAKVNLDVLDRLHESALMEAARRGYADCVQLLVQAHANLDIQSYRGTALTLAAFYGHADCVRILVGAKANLNVQDQYGRTALMSAAKNSCFECVQALIEAGADVLIQDENNRTVSDYMPECDPKLSALLEETVKKQQLQKQMNQLVSKGLEQYPEIVHEVLQKSGFVPVKVASQPTCGVQCPDSSHTIVD